MKRRHFLFSAALCASLQFGPLAQMVSAEPRALSLDEISSYLNELTTVEAGFTQVNWDNSISTGILQLKRPGRLRIEYDEPDTGLVMSIGGQLAIFDKKSNQTPESYPVRRTPLWLLLKRQVNLTDQDMVTGHGFDGTMSFVNAMDPKRPEYGSIQMRFASDPVRLMGWVIYDAHGGETMVALGELNDGVEIDNKHFNIQRMIQILVPKENR